MIAAGLLSSSLVDERRPRSAASSTPSGLAIANSLLPGRRTEIVKPRLQRQRQLDAFFDRQLVDAVDLGLSRLGVAETRPQLVRLRGSVHDGHYTAAVRPQNAAIDGSH